jgi:Tfp pilus tip-associated adhesin PilY1
MFLSAARRFCRRFLPALVALLSCGPSFGALTDLADNPLSSATTATVKPNIFFILDDSGSMNWRFMPDAMSSREDRIGFRNNQCNLVYYNPASRYVVPKTSAGTDVNAGAPTAFTAAYDDGFGAYKGLETRTSADSGATWTAWSVTGSCTADTSGTSRRDCRIALLGSAGATTNLSTSFRAFVDGTIESNSATSKIDTAQPAYYWKYAGATTLIPTQGDCEKVLSPSYTVNNASYSSNVVTFTTSAAHNFGVGDTVAVINIQPSGYRGTYVVTVVPSATTFKVAKASNPGGYTNSGTAWNATRYATVNEYCTDNTTTTSTCAAAGKTALWQKVIVGATSGPATVDVNGDGAVNSSDQDERQNFANWYSYYSKRINMMKSASGRAFVGMTDSKRIGFVTINPGSPVSTQKFRPIGDFDTTTKEDWFNTLYATTTGSSTPLRQALSRAGRYYAGKLDGINSGMFGDPVQYSCQQNFSILTTDGYWNGSAGEQLLGATAIGNQDGVISEQDAYRPAGSKYAMSPRPIFDGASTTFTWNTATQTFQTASCLRQEKKLAQEQERKGEWEQQTSQQQKTLGQVQMNSTIEQMQGQLQFKTTWQRQRGQLRYSSQFRQRTGQLQFATTLQRKTGQLTMQSRYQRKQGQLQFTTKQQQKTGQLQFASTIRARTGQLQFSTNLQIKTGQLERRMSTDSGATWGLGWLPVTSGTCVVDASGSTRTQCRVLGSFAYVTPAAPTCVSNVSGITYTAAGINGSATVECQTAAFTAPANTSVTCTANANTACSISGPAFAPAQSCTSNVSGSTWTPAGIGGNATTECQTGQPVSAWVNVTSGTCTVGGGVSCQITGTPTYVTTYPPTCTSNVVGSTYTAAGAGGSATVECSTTAGFNPTWTNALVCDQSANVDCRVNASFASVQASCTASDNQTGTAGSYSYTGGASAVECSDLGSAASGVVSNVSACTEDSGNVLCAVTGSFSYVTTNPPTCTPTRTGSSGSYDWSGGASAVDCRNTTMNATWTNTGNVCTDSADVDCRILGGTQAMVQSCTQNPTGGVSGTPNPVGGVYTPAGSGGNATVECLTNYALGTFANITSGTCTESATVGQVRNCDINAPLDYITSPAQLPCVSNVSGPLDADGTVFTAAGSGGSTTTYCFNNTPTFNPAWTTVPDSTTCTESADVQCAINGASWAPAQSCTPSHNRGSPLKVWTAAASSGAERDCRNNAASSGWLDTASCSEFSQVEGVNQCQINGSTFGAPNADCASQTRTGSAGSYAYTGGASANYCETVVTKSYADGRVDLTNPVNYACTPAPTPDASGYTTQCQFVGSILNPTPTWVDYTAGGACTPDAITDCRTVDTTGWVVSDICNPVVTPDATGKTTQCRNTATNGSKLQSFPTTTAQTWSGPSQTGTALGAPTVVVGSLSDVTPGACYSSAPAVPPVATVIGSGPPTPPANCSSGTQEWPCETFSAGAGGLSAAVSSALFTQFPDDATDPSTATFFTAAAHQFLVGHSVTIAGVAPSGFLGSYQIIEVPDTGSFKVYMPTPPCLPAGGPPATCASTAGGTATLYAGSSSSLSDVAQYYYKTDLRNSVLANCTGSLGTPVCEDNVPATGEGVEDDRANWQHMTTFTMGLGLTGTVAYSKNYKTDQSVARTISGATWASNVVTVTTTAAHGFFVNQAVTISGATVPAGYRGQFRITSVPSTTTFTYARSPSPGAYAGTGTATGYPDYTRLREGTLNWPVPVADSATALDDLWHAAVNGRGQYFSAGDPDTVVTSLADALAGINARVAAAAAAATSNLEPVAGDNFAYTAKYKTQAWTGDLEAREIDLTTGDVSTSVIWSAQARLEAYVRSACDYRTIKLFRAGATDSNGYPVNLVDFKWDTYACDMAGAATGAAVTTLNAAEQANFNAGKVALLSQYPNLGDGTGATVDQRTAAAGANLVNYLRGQRGKEGFDSGPPATNTDLNKLYRTREKVLGDIVNAQPVFVKAPFAEYDDAGYALFKSLKAGRTPMVYAAANDGMLHAVYAGTSIVDIAGGGEAWAFMPTMVLPNLYKLASENYATEHVFSVDGTPSVGDVLDPAPIDPVTLAPLAPTWKTILVAGLNKGGKGYYALDVTDPEAPKAIWEFKHDAANCVTVDATTKAPASAQYSDCHLGYSFNNPIITKLTDGRWVVIVTSGFNNVNSPAAAGDGFGYLYVLEAMTGKILYKISTGAGSSSDPSGLNRIVGWTQNSLRNNTTDRVYGVDLLGNVWRFDINDILNAAGREATRVTTVVDALGVPQPITTRPELAEVGGDAFVYVASGKYLGTTDLSNVQGQSIWGLRDTLGTTALTGLRTNLREMTITNQGSGTSAYRTNGCTANCGSTDGWFADLPDSGERVNIDMKLQLGTLVVASNVPENNACNIGGYAWLNYFNNSDGQAVEADGVVGRRLVGAGGQESLAVGLNIVRLPSGKTVVIATTSGAQQLTVEAPFNVAPPTGKRVSWREIVQ